VKIIIILEQVTRIATQIKKKRQKLLDGIEKEKDEDIKRELIKENTVELIEDFLNEEMELVTVEQFEDSSLLINEK
jgi:hypothetical protein